VPLLRVTKAQLMRWLAEKSSCCSVSAFGRTRTFCLNNPMVEKRDKNVAALAGFGTFQQSRAGFNQRLTLMGANF
jgi:hypothetical protein